MTTSREDIAAALRLDPLAEAERLTGNDYKNDPETLTLGMHLAMLHDARKEDLLTRATDSHMSMTFAEFVAVMEDEGFDVVWAEKFVGREGPETFHILWHPEGLLAVCESYAGARLNSAKVWYNYRHESGGCPQWPLTSSGGMHDGVWVGDHDAREGIRSNLTQLRNEGAFLPVWVKRPFLWLLNYTDTDTPNYDHHAVTDERISQLPKHVREAITPAGAL